MNLTLVEVVIVAVAFGVQALVALAIVVYIRRRRPATVAAPFVEGWHVDPRGEADLRWFDGRIWTEYTHANDEVSA